MRPYQRQVTAHLPGRGIAILESSFGWYARHPFPTLARVGPLRARPKEIREILLTVAGVNRRRVRSLGYSTEAVFFPPLLPNRPPREIVLCLHLALEQGIHYLPLIPLPLSNPYRLGPMGSVYIYIYICAPARIGMVTGKDTQAYTHTPPRLRHRLSRPLSLATTPQCHRVGARNTSHEKSEQRRSSQCREKKMMTERWWWWWRGG